MTVLGLDARRTGWVACVVAGGRLVALERHGRLAEALGAWPQASHVAVTVPFAHGDPGGGVRACDGAARAVLGPHADRVPWVPPLEVFALPEAEAHARCAAEGWPVPSPRLWSVRERILEVRALADPRIVESNTELSFQVLHESHGGTGHLERPAHFWSGLHDRLRLLHDAGLRPTRSFGGIGKVEPGDLLGATVSAWTAARVAAGSARRFPASGPVALFA